jgi:protoporphyrinogen IX oxidase
MLWILALHVIFMVTWFAGLFYLPRLFVYHALATDSISIERFKAMERKLYYGIMTPGAMLTIICGICLIACNPAVYLHAGWLYAKLFLVLLLIIFHIYCGKLYVAFKHNRNKHSDKFYRWINEIPTLLLIAIVILVVVKPF